MVCRSFTEWRLTGVPVQLLNTQYRMTPDIAEIIHTSGGYCDANGISRLLDDPSTHNCPDRQLFVEWSRGGQWWGPEITLLNIFLLNQTNTKRQQQFLWSQIPNAARTVPFTTNKNLSVAPFLATESPSTSNSPNASPTHSTITQTTRTNAREKGAQEGQRWRFGERPAFCSMVQRRSTQM
jgi:hypothetical protein